MLVRVEDIKDSGLALQYSEAAGEFPELVVSLEQDGIQLTGNVSVEARAHRIGELVEIDGVIATIVDLACSRCLVRHPLPLTIPFGLTYAREVPQVIDEENGAEIELSAEEMGLISFSGDEFDLREAIQDLVILALPVQPLCREDCRGLCPQCGIDRNEMSCDCDTRPMNGKFAALRDFKVSKD